MSIPTTLRRFSGFPPGETFSMRVPDTFFGELLTLIDDLAELKLTLHCFWVLQQRSGKYHYVRRGELFTDDVLLRSLADNPDEAAHLLDSALARAIARGTLLNLAWATSGGDEQAFFLNTERGREAVAAFSAGRWQPGDSEALLAMADGRPNIFVRYEQFAGPLTPLIADKLRDTEKTYPMEWIEAAIEHATVRNVRNWNYVEAVLSQWKTKGPPDGLVRADTSRDRSETLRAYGQFYTD
ncbi:MAG: DnaD domain-containing protein [Aggregatilineales bacterium]